MTLTAIRPAAAVRPRAGVWGVRIALAVVIAVAVVGVAGPALAPYDPLVQNRWGIFFRALLAIPAAIVATALGVAWFFVLIVVWLTALVTARVPRGLQVFGLQVLQYATLLNCYVLLLLSRYPRWEDVVGAGGAAGAPGAAGRPLDLDGPSAGGGAHRSAPACDGSHRRARTF